MNYLLKDRAPGLTAALALAKSQKMLRPEQTATFNGTANQCLEVASNADLAMDVNRPLFCGGWIRCNGPFPPAAPQWGMYKFRNPSAGGGDYGWCINHQIVSGASLLQTRHQYLRKNLASGALAGQFYGASDPGVPTAGYWHFLTWGFDPRTASDNIPRLYNGRRNHWTRNFAETAGFAIAGGTGEPLRFGGTGGAGNNTGVLANSAEVNLASFFLCRPDPTVDVATRFAQIRDDLYNNNFGRSYRSLSDKDKSDMGLVSWWDLDAIDGNQFRDAHGDNHAQIVNGVTLS